MYHIEERERVITIPLGSLLSVAVIGFVPHIYHVFEGVDRLANLTVKLVSGQLGQEVVVILHVNTKSGSATSKSLSQY